MVVPLLWMLLKACKANNPPRGNETDSRRERLAVANLR